MRSLRYRPDIDGLRALAVGAVLIYHAFGPNVLPSGFIGVDIFFVISGFLIARIILGELAEGRFSFANFYLSRARRLFPALVLVLVATWAVGVEVLTPTELSSLGRHIVAGAGFVSNLLIYAEVGYFDLPALTKPLLHLWSLGVEEQFYFVLPLLLALCVTSRVGLMGVIASLFVVSLLLNVWLARRDLSFAFYMPVTRFWEFLLGVWLAYRAGYRTDEALIFERPIHREVGAWVGLMLVICSALFINQHGFPGWRAVFPSVGAFLLIGAGPTTWIAQRVLAHPIAVFVGLISYPLYLWHWPIIVYGRLEFDELFMPWGVCAALALSVVLAWATYQFVERPIRAQRIRWKVPAALTACLIGVAALGVFTARDGISERYPEQIRNVLDSKGYADGYMPWTNDRDKPGPLIVTWGDSHADHILQGLFRLQEKRPFRVAWERWWDACPEDGSGRTDAQRCPAPSETAMSRLRELKPDIALVGVYWRFQADRAEKLRRAVAFLQEIGVRRIIVLGPVPYWRRYATRLIFEAYMSNRQVVPERLLGVEPLDGPIDQEMREIAQRGGATYVSLREMLCDHERGCIAMVGKQPLQSDQSHFTAAGSGYVVDQIAHTLFN